MRTKRQPAGSAVSAFRRLPVAAAVALAISQGAMGATGTVILVDSTASFGPGTLYEAITVANGLCNTGADTSPIIRFTTSGAFTISQSTTLPQFFCSAPVAYNPTIDGFTGTSSVANSDALGWNATVNVVVDGTNNFSTYGCAIEYVDFGGYGGSLTVKGLEVRNFNYGGAPGNHDGNMTGICGKVNVTGSILRNNGNGLFAESGSVIGGDLAAERNLLPLNRYDGIGFDGNTTIKNNLVGIDFDTYGGAFASTGYYAIDWCGCTAATGLIANNVVVATDTGIWAGSSSSSGLTISGNKIGTDPSGGSVLYSGGANGIYLQYPVGTSVANNIIAGWAYGLYMYSGDSVSITGNSVGTNAAGSSALPNQIGIYDAYSYGTQITGNTVSGNSDTGIWISSTSDVLIQDNLIGIDSAASKAIANNTGIYIGFVAANNVINHNTIAGNFIGINSSDASYTTFSNNSIGRTFGGATIGNGFAMGAFCGTNLSIVSNIIVASAYGGLLMQGIENSVLDHNTISGNNGPGVMMDTTFCGNNQLALKSAPKVVFGQDNDSSDNQLNSNTITGNGAGGLSIRGGAGNSLFQNEISGNTGDGVRIENIYGTDTYGATIVTSAAIGNSLQENLIYGNSAKNVNLEFDGGPLPNDAGDADTNKPNNWQNYPVLTGAVYDPGNDWTVISFTLDTKAGDYRIDFFANDGPGAPAAQHYIGNTSMSFAADGSQPGSYAAPQHWNNISAIATRVGPELLPVMDSSELSLQVAGTNLPVPGVNVVPSSINFGDVVVGRSSASSTVTVQSTGTADYVVSSLREDTCSGPAICSTGSFSCSTTCSDGSSWTAPNSCVITAAFTPTALGAQSKTLALCDNTVGSPRTITFTGNGVLPAEVDIAYTPASWSFGEVLVGAQSSIKTFTLVNSGANTVYLAPATVTDGFLITGGTCGAQLAGGASCSTDVQFSPAARGGVNGALQIVGSNTPPAALRAKGAKVTGPSTTTATAILQGSGAQFGDLHLPASIPFGTLVLHSAPRDQSLQLSNSGNGPLAIGSITISGPFTMSNGCGASLDVGASCNVVLTFNPASLGNANGTLNVVTDAPGGSRAIALTATVVADARPVVRISPTLLGFGNRQIGTESTPQSVTITNEGAAIATLGPMVITQPENTGQGAGKSEFSISGTTCGTTLAPQATCVANLVFRALGFGPRQGELSVSSNSADSPQKATMSGTGCRPYAAGGNRSSRDPCAP